MRNKADRTDQCSGYSTSGLPKNSYDQFTKTHYECKVQIPQHAGRCQKCQNAFNDYKASGWGLTSIVAQREEIASLSLCMYCSGPQDSDGPVCDSCKDINSRPDSSTSDFGYDRGNPYNQLFDVERARTGVDEFKQKRSNVIDPRTDSDGNMKPVSYNTIPKFFTGFTGFIPDYQEMVKRIRSTGRYWEFITKRERGTAVGNRAQEKAASFFRVADQLDKRAKEVERKGR